MSSPLVALLFSTFLLLLSSSGADAFNITKILSAFPDFTAFNNILLQSGVANTINSKQTITVLAVANGAMGDASGLSQDAAKKILSVHVILDYYDTDKLKYLNKSQSITLTTLYQESGLAQNQQGFLNLTFNGEGKAVFGSAAPGSQQNSVFVKSIASDPYNISVLQVSNIISINNANSSTTPSPPSNPSSPPAQPPAAKSPSQQPPSKSPASSPPAKSPATPSSPPATSPASSPPAKSPSSPPAKSPSSPPAKSPSSPPAKSPSTPPATAPSSPPATSSSPPPVPAAAPPRKVLAPAPSAQTPSASAAPPSDDDTSTAPTGAEAPVALSPSIIPVDTGAPGPSEAQAKKSGAQVSVSSGNYLASILVILTTARFLLTMNI
ncbi:hypothetical protein COLO4_30898 [Corchorus olitorius]|uniref:FAS1 domain-containing protein n=1 Tax=Corchorus olitorius TaxID=93759 RepID=A0A1R3H6J9_9ROSI|nr:hypothetical protein COLO4_30898 [Corchorus olitorius]